MMAPQQRQPGGWQADRLLQGVLPEASRLADIHISGMTLDSRTVQPGDLFFACAGYQQHGLEYARQAIAAGAVLVVTEVSQDWPLQRIQAFAEHAPQPVVILPDLAASMSAIAAKFYGSPALAMRMLGVTGTNGKTSVSQYIAQAVSEHWKCAVVGTTGNGFPGELEPASHTTPDAIAAQQLLSRLQQAGATAVAMEVSSHALHQQRVAAVPFHTAVFTNLSRDHLDYHITMQAYAEAKASLLRQPGLSLAVLNTDDELGARLAAELDADTKVIACGSDPLTCDRAAEFVRLLDVRADRSGLTISLDTSWGKAKIHSKLVGGFNAQNLALVLAVLLGWQLSLADAVAKLQQIHPVAGRMQCFGGDQQPLVIVDYAHTPDALAKALQAAREHAAGKLTCVFGCGGNRDQGKRPLMGAMAQSLADEVIITDDNPRYEASAEIIRQIVQGMSGSHEASVIANRAEAIKLAVQQAAPGDVVLVAGKGHEEYQQIGDLKQPFSDAQQVAQALRELPHG